MRLRSSVCCVRRVDVDSIQLKRTHSIIPFLLGYFDHQTVRYSSLFSRVWALTKIAEDQPQNLSENGFNKISFLHLARDFQRQLFSSDENLTSDFGEIMWIKNWTWIREHWVVVTAGSAIVSVQSYFSEGFLSVCRAQLVDSRSCLLFCIIMIILQKIITCSVRHTLAW